MTVAKTTIGRAGVSWLWLAFTLSLFSGAAFYLADHFQITTDVRWTIWFALFALLACSLVVVLFIALQRVSIARRHHERLAQDLSEELNQARQNLDDTSRRWRALVDAVPDLVFRINTAGIIVDYHPASLNTLDTPPEQFLHRRIGDILPAETASRILHATSEAVRTGKMTLVEFEMNGRQGRRAIESRFQPISKTEAICLAQDVTGRRQTEAALRQAQKLEAIGTLAGGIAHDFNNILGSIMGFAELARMDARGNASAEENLHEVLRASRRAKSLVQQILAFSRHQETPQIPVQFGSIAQEAIQLLRAAAPPSIEFQVQFSAELPAILSDPTQLHQIVMNLGTNALHAIGSGPGTIRLQLETFEVTRHFAHSQPGLSPGMHVRLTVTDSGAGMPPEVLEHIFEPFFTTKAPGEGSGLGLSVVHGIVRRHHGLLKVESQPDAGTTVQVLLPGHAERCPRTDPQIVGSGISPAHPAPPPEEHLEPDRFSEALPASVELAISAQANSVVLPARP